MLPNGKRTLARRDPQKSGRQIEHAILKYNPAQASSHARPIPPTCFGFPSYPLEQRT